MTTGAHPSKGFRQHKRRQYREARAQQEAASAADRFKRAGQGMMAALKLRGGRGTRQQQQELHVELQAAQLAAGSALAGAGPGGVRYMTALPGAGGGAQLPESAFYSVGGAGAPLQVPPEAAAALPRVDLSGLSPAQIRAALTALRQQAQQQQQQQQHDDAAAAALSSSSSVSSGRSSRARSPPTGLPAFDDLGGASSSSSGPESDGAPRKQPGSGGRAGRRIGGGVAREGKRKRKRANPSRRYGYIMKVSKRGSGAGGDGDDDDDDDEKTKRGYFYRYDKKKKKKKKRKEEARKQALAESRARHRRK